MPQPRRGRPAPAEQTVLDMKRAATRLIALHGFEGMNLRMLADEYCDGRMLAMGGGGYNHDNIAHGWTAVVDAMSKEPASSGGRA